MYSDYEIENAHACFFGYKARRDWQNTREVLGEERRVEEEIENARVCYRAVIKHAGIGRTREKC